MYLWSDYSGWYINRSCWLVTVSYTHLDVYKRQGMLSKSKPYGFTLFAKRYGEEKLLDCLAANEKNGIVYHREGIFGDYDVFDDVEELIQFILTGKRG